MSLDLIRPPDVEELVWRWLITLDEVTTLVAERVYTVLPTDKSYPLVRIVRLALGGPREGSRIPYERVVLQIEAYAERKSEAHDVIRDVRAIFAQALAGQKLELGDEAGVFSRVEVGGYGYIPDPDLLTAKGTAFPRYLFLVELDVRPVPA